MTHYLFGSLTRISDLEKRPFEVTPLPRDRWATGDYVVAEVIDASGLHGVELCSGRMMEAMEGSLVVGAFGARAATLEAVGDWRAIEDDRFALLTPAGLFGRITSCSPYIPRLMGMRYRGHVCRGGQAQTMSAMLGAEAPRELRAPVILITGTSMSAGKTLSGRLIVSLLSRSGLRVAGVKLTGAARYRDVLSFADAGAAAVFDFVDAGLPSTVTDRAGFVQALERLLSMVAAEEPDVVVAEAGASPLEPYNGDAAIEVLGDRVCFNLLCASDPYAVQGVCSAFQRQPDLVAGGAANTAAGVALVEKLTGLRAVNLLQKENQGVLHRALMQSLKAMTSAR